MNFSIELYEMEPFMVHNFQSKIVLSIIIFFILVLGIIIQKKLITFFWSKSRRWVDKIIYANLISQNILTPILLVYFIFSIWNENPGQYIGQYGCFGIYYLLFFNGIMERSHSFFINLFRYVCIVQSDMMKKFNIQPKVSVSLLFLKNRWIKFLYSLQIFVWTVVLIQFLVSSIISIFFVWTPNNIFSSHCMGREQHFYSYNYFQTGGIQREDIPLCASNVNKFFFVSCQFMRVVNWIIWSNLVDIYFLIKISFVLKKQVQSVMKLLTREAFEERKRYVVTSKSLFSAKKFRRHYSSSIYALCKFFFWIVVLYSSD